MKHRFWNWACDADTGVRTLVLNGTIAEDSWFGDEVTPAIFRDELMKGEGDITVWINSPGGDVFAAAQIYNMLMDYEGKVTVRIDGIAASAATMVAMAGSTVEMSPVGMFVVHNPSTTVIGNTDEMQAAIRMLDEVKENIINAYERKTGLPRKQLSDLMDAESWMNAKKAVELGFADKILFADEEDAERAEDTEGMVYSPRAAVCSLLGKLQAERNRVAPEVEDTRVSADILKSRLDLLVH